MGTLSANAIVQMAPACRHLARKDFGVSASISGVTDIAQKTNYSFERRERERNKAAETAKKAQAKADKKAAEQGTPNAD